VRFFPVEAFHAPLEPLASPRMSAPSDPMGRRVAIDLHTHTWRSGDSRTTVERFAAGLEGLGVVAVTDHHDIRSAVEIAARTQAQVIVGEEIDTGQGELIGLYLKEVIPRRLGLTTTIDRIRAQGALVYAPHPLDATRRSLGAQRLLQLAAAGLVDIIEAGNGKMHAFDQRAAAIALAHGIAITSASDAHVATALGGCATLVAREPAGPRDLIELLHGGITRWRHIDPVATQLEIVPGSSGV
jgi:predicted metal-dependent phosphoesterase TrpH